VVQHHHKMSLTPCLTPGETVKLMTVGQYRGQSWRARHAHPTMETSIVAQDGGWRTRRQRRTKNSSRVVRHGRYGLIFFSRADGRLRGTAQPETLAELTALMDNFSTGHPLGEDARCLQKNPHDGACARFWPPDPPGDSL